MPELPEVETVVRELRAGSAGRGPSVVGRTLTGATVRWPRQIVTPAANTLSDRLRGQQVLAVERRGKYLIFSLTHDSLLIHLKMSGDLQMTAAAAPFDKHAHTIFHFTDGLELRFSDTRKFGKVFLVDRAEEITSRLGPEPLAAGFSAAWLAGALAERRRAIKPLLLDQTFIAGLGNIYTDEALHRAGLHPLRASDSLTPEESRGLWRAIRQVLRTGLRHNGASIDWVYRGGGFQNYFQVYGRAGEPCRACGTPIQRRVVGQRGTHFCPHCQPARRGKRA